MGMKIIISQSSAQQEHVESTAGKNQISNICATRIVSGTIFCIKQLDLNN